MTILGNHTLSELRDLLNTYNAFQDQLNNALAGARDQWIAANNAEYQSWQSDYDLWNAQYQPYRTRANSVLMGTPTSMQDFKTDEDTYQALAKAFMPFTDFDRRMRQSHVASVAPDYKVPQQVAYDQDLKAFQTTDKIAQSMPPYVKGFVATVAPNLVPDNKDKPNYDSAASKYKYAFIAGGVLLGLALVAKISR